MRPFGDVTSADLLNELNALNRICTSNHPNIVKVLRHDRLPRSSYYYIDMELCDLNLDQYIQKKWPPHIHPEGRYFGVSRNDISIAWAIGRDIASGLAFIHSVGKVHRDIKPRNSTHLICSIRID